MFGKAREGVHATRIPVVDVAFWDVAMTIVAAYVFARSYGGVSMSTSLLLWFSLGIAMHALFCVPTSQTRFLGSC